MTALLEHFHEAVTTPQDVDKLKKLILQLAMQGKLVEQDPNDEPASELLKKIAEEKQRLFKEKKIKKPSSLPNITVGETPYKLPDRWKWVRLGTIGQIVGGGTPKTQVKEYWTESGKGIPWITPADLGSKLILSISRGRRDITTDGLKNSSTVLLPKGSVLFSSRAPIGYVAIAENQICTNQGFKSVVPYLLDMNFFTLHYLRLLSEEINSKASGTTFKEVSGKDMSLQLFPLPPFNEQKRIVEKIESLFEQCDQLSSDIVKKQTTSLILNKSVFSKLQDHSNPEQLNDLRFVIENMEHLCNDKESVVQLRTSILSLAVQGKLVEQESGDEPAIVFLREIETIKKELSEKKIISKDKKISPVIADKKPPFIIPESWEWVRLQDIYEILRGASPRPSGDPRYFGGNIPWITVGELTKDGNMLLTNTKDTLTELGEQKSRTIYKGELLLTNSGATLGVPKISVLQGCINDGVALLRNFHGIEINKYVYYYLSLQTPAFRAINQGMGQPNLNTAILSGWYIPIPPLNEQLRIIEKIEMYMDICNELERSLNHYGVSNNAYLNSIIKE